MGNCRYCKQSIDDDDNESNTATEHYDCLALYNQRLKAGLCVKCGDEPIALKKPDTCDGCSDNSQYIGY